jgi:hypothetical protein
MARILYLKACLLIFLIFLIPGNVFGQGDPMGLFVSSPRGQVLWIYTRPNFYDTKLTNEQKEMLAPLAEDLRSYAVFLKQENTGIFRLHPKGKYEITGRTVSVHEAAKMRLPILGGGAYYSFAERSNKLGPWSEICLDEGRLHAGGLNKAIGILTGLGDVSLESVTLKTAGLDFLTSLAPPKKYSELAELVEKSAQGFQANDFIYGSFAKAALNTTYVLRSILYKKDGYVVHPHEPYYRLRMSSLGYKGSDNLFAFRIIRRHEDGSITIVWRRLQKFAASKIKGNSAKYNYDEVEQLLEQKLAKGMSAKQLIDFLDTNGIEHTEYVEASQDEISLAGTTAFVYANIPDIERKIRVVFDLDIQFSFNDKSELLGWTLKKNRR